MWLKKRKAFSFWRNEHIGCSQSFQHPQVPLCSVIGQKDYYRKTVSEETILADVQLPVESKQRTGTA
jgi:hypothetical protein